MIAVVWGCLTAQTVLASTGQLVLTVIDKDTGKPVACRMHLVGPKKKPFNPGKVPFWNDHFDIPGKITLRLPIGEYSFVLERGLEYLTREGHFTINHFADDATQVDINRFIDMAAEGWWSGDLDIRRPARDIELLMDADDLHVAEVQTWQNGQTPTDKDSAKQSVMQFNGNRFYSLMAGRSAQPGNELLLLRLSSPLELPDEKNNTPPVIELLQKHQSTENLWVDASKPFWWDLPMWAAVGPLNSIEVAHSHICRDSVIGNEAEGRPRDRTRYPDPWGNAQWSQFIYFQLLECGLRIPPSAGSGSGDSPNPVGYNRVYVHVDGDLTYEKWWDSFAKGQVVVTNGPLLIPSVNGQLPGHVFEAAEGANLDFEIGLTLSTREPISYLEIVKDGHVEHTIPLDVFNAQEGRLPKLHFERSGWFLVRAVTDLPKTYRFAMTGPYYVEIGGQKRISKQACQFFLDWVYERARRIKQSDIAGKEQLLYWQRQARDFWQNRLTQANAE